MIRYIVTILHEIGCGHEEPEVKSSYYFYRSIPIQIVNSLLDVAKNPSRPQYGLAADSPLCLFECAYQKDQLNWIYEEDVRQRNLFSLQKQWAELRTRFYARCLYLLKIRFRARILENMMNSMANEPIGFSVTSINQGLNEFTQVDLFLCRLFTFFLQAHPWQENYVPILKRKKCASLEEKRAKLEEKIEKNNC